MTANICIDQYNITVNNIPIIQQALVEVNAETGKSTFDLQFETLNSTSPSDDEFDCSVAQLPDNAAKNRFKEHLPCEWVEGAVVS